MRHAVVSLLVRRRPSEDVLVALVCLAPALAVIGIFVVYPIVYAAYLSLTSWDGFSPERPFVGLDNYAELFGSPEFHNSLVVTVNYALGVTILGLVTGLAAALVLDRVVVGRAFYRSVFFLPVLTSGVAAAVVWRYLFDQSGVVNDLLGAVGLPKPGWLSDPSITGMSVILVTVWKRLGFNAIIFLAALQAIPNDYYDAARVDGAGPWQRLRHITMPLLIPTSLFLSVMSLIDAFQVFDLVFVMTQGGPVSATDVMGFMMYRHAFRFGEVGYGAAIAYAVLGLIFVVTLIQWRLARQRTVEL